MTKILVIEDEKALLEEILGMLNFEGYETIGAGNGHAGIRLAKDQKPDLIISDIMMPGLDGYDVLLELRTDDTTAMIPFIFLTAKTDRGDVRQGMELGADDYLTKPFTRKELLNTVQVRLARQMMIVKNKEEEIEQAKKTLVQNITRELRAPMESIDLVQELIEREMGRLTPQDLRDFLETLRSGSRRIRHVVEQIVYLAQIQTGVLQYDSLKGDGMIESLWKVVAEAVKTARRFANCSRGASVVLHERDEGKFAVRCYPYALEHALAELITNALNYSPAKSVVEVLVWKSNNIARISISNQGGISGDRSAWGAPDSTHQVDMDNGQRPDMGLGLPLAHRIIAEHGGTFELDMVVDAVTRAVISLPLAD